MHIFDGLPKTIMAPQELSLGSKWESEQALEAQTPGLEPQHSH